MILENLDRNKNSLSNDLNIFYNLCREILFRNKGEVGSYEPISFIRYWLRSLSNNPREILLPRVAIIEILIYTSAKIPLSEKDILRIYKVALWLYTVLRPYANICLMRISN